jgi:regulator of protease activity HflC (stomatin/prohibitin superfamily)
MRRLLPLLLLSILPACANIDPGNIGVVTDSISGAIKGQPLPAGWHFVGLWKNVFEYPTVVENISLDDLRVNTREGQQLTVGLRVQYRPLFMGNDNVVKLYQKYKKPFDGANGVVQTRWLPVIQQVAGYSFSQAGVIEVYQSRGAKVAADMKNVLQHGLHAKDADIEGIGEDFVEIETVAVSHIELPEAIQKSVEMKAQIEQETLAAQQQLAKSRMEAERKRIEAQGEADSKLIKSRGEATARSALGLTPEQYTRLEIARMTTTALKDSKNLMIVPSNSILDTRALVSAASKGREE